MLMDFVWLQQQTFIDNNEAKLKKSVCDWNITCTKFKAWILLSEKAF